MSNMLWWFDTKIAGRPAARTPARSTARRVPHRRRLAVSDFWSPFTTISCGRRPKARARRCRRSKTRRIRPKAARNGTVKTQSRMRAMTACLLYSGHVPQHVVAGHDPHEGAVLAHEGGRCLVGEERGDAIEGRARFDDGEGRLH